MLPAPQTPHLIQKSLGIELSSINQEKQAGVIKDVLEAFYTFIFEFTEIEYCRADAIKLKTAHQNNIDIFSKFPELEKKYQHATEQYFKMLEDSNSFIKN